MHTLKFLHILGHEVGSQSKLAILLLSLLPVVVITACMSCCLCTNNTRDLLGKCLPSSQRWPKLRALPIALCDCAVVLTLVITGALLVTVVTPHFSNDILCGELLFMLYVIQCMYTCEGTSVYYTQLLCEATGKHLLCSCTCSAYTYKIYYPSQLWTTVQQCPHANHVMETMFISIVQSTLATGRRTTEPYVSTQTVP